MLWGGETIIKPKTRNIAAKRCWAASDIFGPLPARPLLQRRAFRPCGLPLSTQTEIATAHAAIAPHIGSIVAFYYPRTKKPPGSDRTKIYHYLILRNKTGFLGKMEGLVWGYEGLNAIIRAALSL
jgi:hypothetical protein